MPVLPPLANLPTLFPSEILEKILSIPEARCAKQFGGGKKLVLGCFLLLFSGFVLFGLFFFSIDSAYNSYKFDFCYGVQEQSFFTTAWLDTGTLR